MLKKLISKLTQKSQPTNYYITLGESHGLQSLVESFYTKMQTDPKAQDCLKLHPLENNQIPIHTKEKLFMFLSGWLGGPNLFMEKIGPPRMRARHLKFKITQKEADQWLYCMSYALDNHEKKLKKYEKITLLNSFKALSLRIINSN